MRVEQCDIGTGAKLQRLIGKARQAMAARIDDDQPRASARGTLEESRGDRVVGFRDCSR
jgi:hypothetical protein